MRAPTLTFRCASRSERQEFHTITVENQTVLCSCVGTDWCSHIHATLVAGERNMVPFEEWDTVDQAEQLLKGILQVPPNWKSHWQEDKIWRGLAEPRQTTIERAIRDGKPTICFIGEGQLGNRADYVEEASDLGWQVVEMPSPLVTLVVFNPRRMNTKKAVLAIDIDLPRITFDDWDLHAYDFTEAVLDAIESNRPETPSSTSDRIAA